MKYNGGVTKENLNTENLYALSEGISNLNKHIYNMKHNFGLPVIVSINKFFSDTDQELNFILNNCKDKNVEVSICECFSKGSEGGIDLAEKVISLIENEKNNFKFTYDNNDKIYEKIQKVTSDIYGAKSVILEPKAQKEIEKFEKLGYGHLPICMAKTQYSLSDDAKKLGCPTDFSITIKNVTLSAGAGFIVISTGDIMKMPGLSRMPSAHNIDVDSDGNITGLF